MNISPENLPFILFLIIGGIQIYLIVLFIELCHNTRAIRKKLEEKDEGYSWEK